MGLVSRKLISFVLLILTIENSHSWSTGRDLMFNKFGEFGFKQYFIPKYMVASWHEARRLCEEFGMEFARLELASEAGYIYGVLSSYGTSSLSLNLDGVASVPGSKTGWYWTKSRYPIDYELQWNSGEPNNSGGNEPCLSLGRTAAGVVGFNDIACSQTGTQIFLCQIKHENFLHRIINSQYGGK